jgi:tRNA(Ile)-lysidine synthase
MIKGVIQSFFEKNKDLCGERLYAIAVSGGPDSMALAHALLTSFPDKEFHILSVDHGLRSEAKAEIDTVEAWCEQYQNAVFQRFLWGGDKPDTAVMEAARLERYHLMAEYCAAHNIEHLFLGHHQDDQAETFLIRLAKGSGLDGLGAMASVAPSVDGLLFCRPLLDVAKEDILSYCVHEKLPFVQDPSNENDKYLRPRLREARDVLEKEGLTSKRLSATARRLARASAALSELTITAYAQSTIIGDGNTIEIDADKLAVWPDEIRLRVLKKALENLQPTQEYGTRYKRIEDLHDDVWACYDSGKVMKRRSLGYCFFSYDVAQKIIKIEKDD